MINNFVIFGDSYSTHKDYIPDGYPHYYCSEGRCPEEPQTKMLPEQTWWGQLMRHTDGVLVLNNSWSGSTIGYTGYDGDCSESSSFIYRYQKLWDSGFFKENKIDTIFVFGGTNDSWCDAPLGKAQLSDWHEDDLFQVLPAICYFGDCLKRNHPDVRIVFIANCDIKSEIIDCLHGLSRRIGAECVQLRNIDKVSNHPTILGMRQICEQILQQLHCCE